MATPMSASTFVSVLKREGVKVSERYSGWRTHNRNHKGAWGGVNGVLIHHTAGRDSRSLCYNGRSDLPGPLCHTHLAKNGTATMMSAGRANHAGPVARNAHDAVVAERSTHPRPSAASGTVDGNAHYYGIEIENLGTGKDPYPAAQYDTAVRWAAAICRHHGWGADSVVGHKETSVEGKPDPSFDMNRFRRDVAARLRGPASGGGSVPDSIEKELAAMDKKTAYHTFWTGDYAPAPKTSSTIEDNPTWMPISVLVGNYEQTSRARDDIQAIAEQLSALSKSVAALSAQVAELAQQTQ
ncbi:N-acetylmuramoyl-L-alanine amidase [Streptomyces cacaoi]|uniref:N-acetylmuramoyl-L-alanine amidase n=1 Tax=Streptomyces cacaoi TaxID=1898 RepID=UPI0037488948